jgi:biopolymer transport protein ExbD
MQKRAPLAAINITPLVDVLLILVVVLLLLAPHFVKPLPVELPRTALAGAPMLQSSLRVAVLANGKFWVDGHETSASEIKTLIKPGVTTLEIGADGKAPYAAIVDLVELLRDANPREVVLLTQ